MSNSPFLLQLIRNHLLTVVTDRTGYAEAFMIQQVGGTNTPGKFLLVTIRGPS